MSLHIKDDGVMKEYPPVVLVDTWLYLIKNQKSELDYIQFPLRKVIKYYFGTMELAQLYVEQLKDDEIDVYFI
ncbi:MAG: hypothetical protein ACJAXJ_002473 [Colwellia sp.]|jgi:hypothetical protein|tara:strand:- start:1233 stop:1451 length:219 start_codon:yes stop_codon:yes gene_type:complete